MSKLRELSLGPFIAGIDNVSPEGSLPAGSLAEAINVDLDMAGDVFVRSGRVPGLAGSGKHSGWTSPSSGLAYAVSGGNLVRLNCDGTTITETVVGPLELDAAVSFDDLNGEVVFANSAQIGIIEVTDTIRSIGPETPAQPSISNNAAGSLPPGRYSGAVSFLNSARQESGLSPIATVEVGDGQGMQFTVDPPVESGIASVNFYRTETGGEKLYLASNAPIDMAGSFLLGNTRLGRIANNYDEERMPPGHIVRSWNGFLLVAFENVLVFSSSFAYGRYNPKHDMIPFPKRIRIMEPVAGGVYIGTGDGVIFMAGTKPDDLRMRYTGGKAPVEGCSKRIDAAELGGDVGGSGERYALWFGRNGFVLGSPDGHIQETQSRRIKIPESQFDAVGSLLVHNRRVTAVLQA